MELDYYRAAFRKKGGHALLDDEAAPFRVIKKQPEILGGRPVCVRARRRDVYFCRAV